MPQIFIVVWMEWYQSLVYSKYRWTEAQSNKYLSILFWGDFYAGFFL